MTRRKRRPDEADPLEAALNRYSAAFPGLPLPFLRGAGGSGTRRVAARMFRCTLAEAGARLAGYEPRLGEAFPLQAELDEKRAALEMAAQRGSGRRAMDAATRRSGPSRGSSACWAAD